ncbi:MAG: ferredoxin [Crenarchaeota archaeon]|nr:ferredoxin [Thermoproteota archaeon]
MPVDEHVLLRDGVLRVAELMAIAAKTAPKAKGIDNIVVSLVRDRNEIDRLAKKMEELAEYYGDFMARDAENVRRSVAVLLIGAKIVDLKLRQPPRYSTEVNTVMALVNLGIALGSAVKTASMLNVDNRIMFSVGVAAQELGLIDADFAFGIPLSATGKNIFFDRKWPRR